MQLQLTHALHNYHTHAHGWRTSTRSGLLSHRPASICPPSPDLLPLVLVQVLSEDGLRWWVSSARVLALLAPLCPRAGALLLHHGQQSTQGTHLRGNGKHTLL
jgi:hypothetical protein